MFFKSKIDELKDEKLKIFVDMDGTISDYDMGGGLDYSIKRPLKSNISQIEEIADYKNVELYILSVSRHNSGIKQKQEWLDKYVPFIKKENRIIISREANDMKRSRYIKLEYLEGIDRSNCKVIVIDDDPAVLDELKAHCPDIILMKDTVLVD